MVMSLRHQVQLITYPDSLGGDLPALHRLLKEHFTDIFPGGIHILPPYPSSANRGFAPLTYFEIEPRFGAWDDIRRISEDFPVLLDLMVNHISRHSPYFKDFIRRGRKSKHADLFLTLDKIWQGGEPDSSDVAKIFLRRPAPPFTEVTVEKSGVVEKVWATFGAEKHPEHIDLDVHSPAARKLFQDVLEQMASCGVKIVRLDAAAFVIKKPGTSCFFVEPELWDFLGWIRREAERRGIEVLPEVHARFEYQQKLAEHGYWVYNFALPLLVLHTLLHKTSRALVEHLMVCPRRQFTMLDCHDGIPVQPDLDGIIDVDSAQDIVRICLQRGATLSRIFSESHRLRPDFDAHQINITYFSALDRDENAYIAARAIQLFAPGIPQIYYVGLLAGENDYEALSRTGERRAINRHDYSPEEVRENLGRPVVQRLLKLIRFRNEHPAFQGEFEVLETPEKELVLRWHKGEAWCELRVDLDLGIGKILSQGEEGGRLEYSL